MLIELLIGVAVPILGLIYANGGISGASMAEQYEMPPPPRGGSAVLYGNIEPQQAPVVRLVIELLKKGEGWEQDGKYLYHKEADLRLLRMLASDGKQWRIFINNGEHFERVELSDKEEIHVGKAVTSYNTKLAEHRKLALAKVVAERLTKQSILAESRLGNSGSAGIVTMGGKPLAITHNPEAHGLALETVSRNSPNVIKPEAFAMIGTW